jgi:SPP1 family predicted phage head-tail adaptor
MPLNPGRLDRRITLQSSAATRDGAGGNVLTWSEVATVWAQEVSTTGREFRAAGALRAETTIAFRIRYLNTAAPAMRISYNGKLYDILSVVEEGRRESQLIQAATATGITP